MARVAFPSAASRLWLGNLVNEESMVMSCISQRHLALCSLAPHYTRDMLSLPQLLSVLLAIIPLGVAWRLLSKRPSSKPSLRSVAILVLGDIGRSPRMMYHAESFAKLHFETFLIGYEGSFLSTLVFIPELELCCRLETSALLTVTPAYPLSISVAAASIS